MFMGSVTSCGLITYRMISEPFFAKSPRTNIIRNRYQITLTRRA